MKMSSKRLLKNTVLMTELFWKIRNFIAKRKPAVSEVRDKIETLITFLPQFCK